MCLLSVFSRMMMRVLKSWNVIHWVRCTHSKTESVFTVLSQVLPQWPHKKWNVLFFFISRTCLKKSWSKIPQCLELKRTTYSLLTLNAAYSCLIVMRHHFESRLLRSFSVSVSVTVIAFHVNTTKEKILLLLRCLLTKMYSHTTCDDILFLFVFFIQW